jgi:hypothetical protein
MVCFQTKVPILGKFWMVFKWKVLMYFMTLWSVLQPLGIFWSCGIFWVRPVRFGMLHKEKSGNPA